MNQNPLPENRGETPNPAVGNPTPEPQATDAFPIIGIGASAGGFEALEQFIARLPVDCGMAIVIVQHLDPTRKGLMPELLQRATAIKVSQVVDRTRVCPNHVYVIPPNNDMSILRGFLHLSEPAEKRGRRLPIDFFLHTLARDRGQRAIGVILSGMGSDGTAGMQSIRDHGGLTVAQEPGSAKFDSMPRSIIDAGLADIVAPAGDLPERIIAHLGGKPIPPEVVAEAEPNPRGSLRKILIHVRERTGHDFAHYKKNTLHRRIERRMGIHQIDKITAYVRFLHENPEEIDLLFKELLIGVTGFFRDPQVWKWLSAKSLPKLISDHPTRQLRAWVAGCSTGEEAYTLAILFREVVEKLELGITPKLQIFATDLDRDAIDKARRGLFSEKAAEDLTSEQLRRYFSKEGGGYRVRAEIREMVIFSPHSLIMDPPFTKLDILTCRNLLIYLDPEMQKKLFPLFHYSLNSGGILVLGNAETTGQFTGWFTTVCAKSRIYQRIDTAVRADPVEFPSSFAPGLSAASEAPEAQRPHANLQTLAEQLLMRRFAPPAVLVNDTGNIIHITGKTGKHLEPAAGKVNLNIFAMAREGLDHELSSGFQKALRQAGPVTLHGLRIGTNGGTQHADVIIERLEGTEPLAGLVLIAFCDRAASVEAGPAPAAGSPSTHHTRIKDLELELGRNREALRDTHEAMQTSQEELRSTNEELQTVNAELQGRLDELSLANNDMKNLLNSTEVATLFLDKELNIRRYTSEATKIIKLIPGDVGRSITDLASELIYPELCDDVRDILRKPRSIEKPIRTRDARWFSVRIMPYRTLSDHVDGVVITFWDITESKTLETRLQEMQIALQDRLDGKSSELVKAKDALKAQRGRSLKT